MLAGEVWTRLEGRWEDELGMRRRRAVERTRKQISQCSESVDETERRNRGVEATGEQRTSRGICKVCRRERRSKSTRGVAGRNGNSITVWYLSMHKGREGGRCASKGKGCMRSSVVAAVQRFTCHSSAALLPRWRPAVIGRRSCRPSRLVPAGSPGSDSTHQHQHP